MVRQEVEQTRESGPCSGSESSSEASDKHAQVKGQTPFLEEQQIRDEFKQTVRRLA